MEHPAGSAQVEHRPVDLLAELGDASSPTELSGPWVPDRAPALAFFVSDAAAYINGATIWADGGGT